VLGKTNTPELGTRPVTESELNGVCRNPWDRTRTPGGSSGGAAAAVAAGLAPVAHASDGGGSIRIPASCCGLFGLKPSRGRVTPAPYADVNGLGTAGTVARTVADAAALLDVLAGPESGDPWDVFDVVLTPTLALRPVPIGWTLEPDDPWEQFDRGARFSPFTALANVTGQPAASVPFDWSEDGLPLGVHLIGRPFAEATLLQLAAQLEQARPWAERLPEGV
jgi:Asp-tRNA(Asn)/Glu-tRNA(Gln) amidotransferase A subunit family amidase